MLWTSLCRIRWWRLPSAAGALSPFKPLYKQGWCLGLCQPLCSAPGAHRGSGWVEKSTTLKAAPTDSPSHKRRIWVLTYRIAKEFILVTHSRWVVESQWPRGASRYWWKSHSLCGQSGMMHIRGALFNLISLSAVIINTVCQSAAGALPPSQKCSIASPSCVADWAEKLH